MACNIINNGDGTLRLEGVCPISGATWALDGIDAYSYNRWKTAEALIQDAFPGLSTDDRELLITGITPDAWESLFPEEDGS